MKQPSTQHLYVRFVQQYAGSICASPSLLVGKDGGVTARHQRNEQRARRTAAVSTLKPCSYLLAKIGDGVFVPTYRHVTRLTGVTPRFCLWATGSSMVS